MDDLLEGLQGQKVGVFAVCGQPKNEVDLMMSEHSLRFKVSNHPTAIPSEHTYSCGLCIQLVVLIKFMIICLL